MIDICICNLFFILKIVNNYNMFILYKFIYGGIYKVFCFGNFYIKINLFKNYYLVDVI